jgi:hypothetical protein
VLVDVVAVLDVAVAAVDVVHVIAMGDHLAAVSLSVRARVVGVHRLLAVALVAVHMVDVAVVLDDLAPVARAVLVIDRFSVGSHLSSLPAVWADDTSVRLMAEHCNVTANHQDRFHQPDARSRANRRSGRSGRDPPHPEKDLRPGP